MIRKQMNYGVIKRFGADVLGVEENVSRIPLIEKNKYISNPLKGIFCLRIDADEYTKPSFAPYHKLFEKYNNLITIFFCASSFKDACDEIRKCRESGVDIQSHGFYHHTYNDYQSNRYNIEKAKSFFDHLGIHTIGYAAPMGKWNRPLARALEDEGYGYSSDFEYDYLGLPSYPSFNGITSKVLQIPVFPVAPELFFQKNLRDLKNITAYYKGAIDEMIFCNLPVIIYAHTSTQYADVPALLGDIVEYAVSSKGLKPMQMTAMYDLWKKNLPGDKHACVINKPGPAYIGRQVALPLNKKIKYFVKEMIDFERATPDDELHCSQVKKRLKIWARKFL
jgi:hypothetical protein